ncbi:hypothetical protein [Aureimonas sp. AU12]|uniref:hypothetical protein n=1 Tax=Aureimonas sp. AU12 TaxID=1638161 RepID=UPI00078234AB|nr:hypothetical protein [Aureimonas sp. AU12]
MIDLYRRSGGVPEPLPSIAYTDDGYTRTNLASEADTRSELGFEFFATIDPAMQRVVKRGDAYLVEILPPDPVRVSADLVTMRQAQIALLDAGLLDQADGAIAAMTGTAGRLAQIEWAKATVLRRDHPLIAALGSTLGLDEAAIDALFAKAAQIT